MKNVGWDAYQIFLLVARQGGLTGAARQTGLSPATIGRRMLALESELGRPLFLRSQTGYGLTADGRCLFDQLQTVEAATAGVEAWARGLGAALVRVTAGTWIAWLIARNMTRIRRPGDDFRIDLQIGERRALLGHRETDVALRAVEPEEPNLVAVRAGTVAYAAYVARGADAVIRRQWIAVTEEECVSAYLRWPWEEMRSAIAITVGRPRSLRDLVLAGAGVAVLPCFVGDADGRLERLGERLPGLAHQQWVVTNLDDRHRRDIRSVADRLRGLLRAEADRFSGAGEGEGTG